MIPRTLRTSRLILRPPETDDAEAIFDGYARDPEVVRFLFWSPHARIGETREFLRTAARAWDGERRFPWVILRRSAPEDGPIGMIELRVSGHAADVGYVLAREAWSRGYMTEALRAVVRAALGTSGLRRISAYCHVDNRASIRVMEKVGMRREGVLRKYAVFPNRDPEPADCVLFAAVR